jgi:phage baseplate assembly protein W
MTNKFLGAPYPIVSTARGLLATQRGVDQIKADLLQLLLTNPGERVMLPGFGTPLREIIFEPNDATSSEQVRDMIINSIRTWEPRITIEQIDVSTQADQESLHEDDSLEDIGHIMIVRILFFDPENISEVQELKLEVPLAGVTGE